MDLTQADDHDINESLHAFEAAVSARKHELDEIRPRRLLVMLDGLNQDETVLGLGAAIARRHDAELRLGFAYEGGADEQHEAYLVARRDGLREQGLAVDSLPPEQREPERRPFQLILEAQQTHACDLVAVSAPYLDEFTDLGNESVGTNLDMLMSRSPVPLLVIREPKERPAACLERITLPVTLLDGERTEAASWALGIVASSGIVRVLAVVDREHLEAAGRLIDEPSELQELDVEFLSGLREPALAGLVGALQRRAAEIDVGCRVSVRVGDVVAVVEAESAERDAVIVTACPREPAASAFARVQAVVRGSRQPVLVV
ncbi:MAG: hypothetical protein ACYTGC_16950 [Planctomycetota bacterium]|jgi:hypothetical protein